jgi:hypothetical protein
MTLFSNNQKKRHKNRPPGIFNLTAAAITAAVVFASDDRGGAPDSRLYCDGR